jgi:undecaprenyl diphosphate synthase
MFELLGVRLVTLEIDRRGAALMVAGDDRSAFFPDELQVFRIRQGAGMRVNFLTNYDWEWDLASSKRDRSARIKSQDWTSLSAGVGDDG